MLVVIKFNVKITHAFKYINLNRWNLMYILVLLFPIPPLLLLHISCFLCLQWPKYYMVPICLQDTHRFWNALSLPNCIHRTKILDFWYQLANRVWNCKQLLGKLYWRHPGQRLEGLWNRDRVPSPTTTTIMTDGRRGKQFAIPLLYLVLRKVHIIRNCIEVGMEEIFCRDFYSGNVLLQPHRRL